MPAGTPILLIDTCEGCASVALARGNMRVETRMLPERAASAMLAGVVRTLLKEQQIQARDLRGVGVVSGPGSFTGVRVGLAFAKGLCVAAEVPLVTVSRLLVLAGAAFSQEGAAVIEAGRSAVYLRDVTGAETMTSYDDAASRLAGQSVALTDGGLGEHLRLSRDSMALVRLTAAAALKPVLARLDRVPNEVAYADANYVRDEQAIYRRAPGGATE